MRWKKTGVFQQSSRLKFEGREVIWQECLSTRRRLPPARRVSRGSTGSSRHRSSHLLATFGAQFLFPVACVLALAKEAVGRGQRVSQADVERGVRSVRAGAKKRGSRLICIGRGRARRSGMLRREIIIRWLRPEDVRRPLGGASDRRRRRLARRHLLAGPSLKGVALAGAPLIIGLKRRRAARLCHSSAL